MSVRNLRSGGDMIIRAAKPDEVAVLTDIAQESKQHWGYAPEVMETWHSTLTLQSVHIDLAPPMVAEDNGETVGFYQLIADGDKMELEHLWVKPQRLNQGIGKQLMAHAITTAKQKGAKRISIDADPNATAFFLSCGARRVGESPAPMTGQAGRARQLLEISLA